MEKHGQAIQQVEAKRTGFGRSAAAEHLEVCMRIGNPESL
jgi:hypothetical protein